MCGRYASSSRPEDLVEQFEVDEDRTGQASRSILANPQSPPAGQPDYNMAPTRQALVVLTRAAQGDPGVAPFRQLRQLRLLTWGLVPNWSKNVKVGLRLINARSEILLDKPAFARAAAVRRCLVPADGWYEWQASPTAVDGKGKPRKQPFFIHRSDGAPLAMAGVYEFWHDPSKAEDDPDAWMTTYTIITTRAEPGLDRIHDRQPLVLERAAWDDWLDPGQNDLSAVMAHLGFSEPGRFDAYPVSTAVNSSRSNGERLLLPLVRADLVGVVDPTTGEIIGE